jgi:hypothetical protein
MARRLMAEHGITRDEARQRIADTLPARRFGRPEEFGLACAFLCGADAGFITGQNLQLDGGAYAGLVGGGAGVVCALDGRGHPGAADLRAAGHAPPSSTGTGLRSASRVATEPC